MVTFRRAFAGVLVCVLASGVASTQVPCTPLSFGDPSEDPLTIQGEWILPPSCTLDFGDREVILEGTVRGTDLTILAGDFTLLEDGLLDGAGGVTTIVLQASAGHEGAADLGGAVENNGPHGGGIVVEASGAVDVSGTLEASAADSAGSGGFVSISTAGAIGLDGERSIVARAGPLGDFGGEVSLASTGSAVTVAGAIEVRGGSFSPGAIIVSSGSDLTVKSDLLAAGLCEASSCSRGGVVRLTSGARLEVGGRIEASGADGGVYSEEGRGGEVALDAVSGIEVAAEMVLAGGSGSRGGDFRARTDGDFIQRAVAIDAAGRAEDSSGGAIEIDAALEVEILGSLLAGGGESGNGGRIVVLGGTGVALAGDVIASANYPTGGIEVVSAAGGIDVAARLEAAGTGLFGTGGPIGLYAVETIALDGAAIDASGSGADGLGGLVALDSFQGIVSAGAVTIRSSGDASDPALGDGGAIDVKACQVLLAAAKGIEAAGALGGEIRFTSADALAIAGGVVATEDGLIQLFHPTGQPPVLDDAEFMPDAVVSAGIVLEPCFTPPPCDPVAELSCALEGSGVALAWERSAGQSALTVLRDGVEIAALEPSVEEYLDPDVPAGPHVYLVRAACADREETGVSCEITVGGGGIFQRGNCNAAGGIDISDAIGELNYLFQGVPATLSCEDACDVNDDGLINISDPIKLLSALFVSTDPLPPPYPDCGPDETEDSLACEGFDPCG